MTSKIEDETRQGTYEFTQYIIPRKKSLKISSHFPHIFSLRTSFFFLANARRSKSKNTHAKTIRTEQRAIMKINRLESRVAVGHFKNLTDHFSDLRQRSERMNRTMSFDDGESSLISGEMKSPDEEEKTQPLKGWIANKTNWDGIERWIWI